MPSSPERWRGKVAALLLLFSGIELLFRSSVLFGQFALYQRDLFLLYFPLVQSALRGLSQGALPLRDASSAFGQPLLGDPSCQILYPPVALHLLLPPHLAYAWFVSLHSVFGALGVGLLARRFSGGSWLAAAVGGVAWLVSGPLQSMATLWHHQAGAAWIPWVLLCAVRVADGDRGRGSIVLGGVFGAQILAGSADMCAMTALLCAVFVPPVLYARAFKAWVTSVVIALALSAGIWLPAAELVRNSLRSALPEATRTYWSLHPFALLEFFLPVPLSAFPFLPEWRTAIFEGREAFLGSMFLGTMLLPLALAALADAAIPRRTRLSCFIGAAFGFLIALGKNASAYAVAVTLLPPLRILRFPSKAMIPVTVLICALAGMGIASLARSERARKAALGACLFLGAVGLTLMSPLLDRLAGWFFDPSQGALVAQVWRNLPLDLLLSMGLLFLLAACVRWPQGRLGLFLVALLVTAHVRQSYSLHRFFNSTVPTALLSYKPEHLPLLLPPAGSRLFVYDYSMFQGLAEKHLGHDLGGGSRRVSGLEGMTPDAINLIASRAYLTPLTGAFWGVDYAWDADLRLLFDRRLARLTLALRAVESTPGFIRLLQTSGVSRVAARHEDGMEGLRLIARLNAFHPEDMRVYEVPSPLPLAQVTSGRSKSTGSDIADLLDIGFDPSRATLVDEDPIRPAAPDFESEAIVVERRPDHLTVETTSNAPGFLRVLEGYMPGWRVWVDGRPEKLERANAIFIGAEVPAGKHRVEFRYLPFSAVVGVSLSALTAVFLFFRLLLTGRDPGPEPPLPA